MNQQHFMQAGMSDSSFLSITVTPTELSIVAEEKYEKSLHCNSYIIPSWAVTIINIFKLHNINIKHLNVIGQGEIIYITIRYKIGNKKY